LSRHELIGIFIDPLHGYRDLVLAGFGQYVRDRKRRWRPIVINAETPHLAEQLATWRGDGIVYSATNELMQAAVDRRRGRVPVVNVSGGRNSPAHSVVSDNVAVGAMAAEHLLEHAFQRYLLVGGSMSYAQERREGFLARLHAAGVRCDTYATAGDAFLSLRRLLDEARPVGVFAADDLLAMTLMYRCAGAGMNVPRDVAILGAGNWQSVCRIGSPALSSVDVDFPRRGYLAAAMLDELMAGHTVDGPVLVPPREVISRESTAVFGYSQASLRRAVEYIVLHADQPITVRAVTAAAGVSRRTLEQQFADVLRRSIHDEIWRQHVACARRLLSTSDLSMTAIARQCGFGSASSFSTVFQRHTGRSPRDYRLEFGGHIHG
jgi:LacI family transcriptional regulator